ncbi:unnamed protein product [Cuscuta epithymum]|uniref:NTF2 domain-containing protein n=1 Tax=Cuscuta epithymum TaxID=186058 RepID=A0AAV0F6S3_9ASTE|nr:unnamed protein product [Cuscuta epithymum]
MTGRYSAENVGCTFTEEYYHVLHQRPEDTHQFYMDSSVADWEGKDGAVHSVTTIKRINDMILSSDYKDSDIEVKSFYAQNSFKGSILLVVTGNFTGKDDLTRTFSHTFHLARKETRIFVLSDILRFLDTHPSTCETENVSVLKASEVPSSNNSVNGETSMNPLMQFPSPPDSVKVDEDLSLSLVPRVKLNYTFACIGSFFKHLDDYNVKSRITNLLYRYKVCNKQLTVPFDDIHVHFVRPTDWKENDEGEDMWIFADGYLYIRDQRIICKEFHVGLRNFVLKKLSTANKVRVMDATYQITLTLPLEEDPDQMMAALSNTLQTGDNPGPSTLIFKGLPQWFVHQSTSVRIFLETMGVVRHLDVEDDGISVEYEDFYKALNSLCGCSLQLERAVEGPSLIDYVLTWKGLRVCDDDDPTFICPLLKKEYRHPGLQ